jgi:bifunctional non-homologous end joining protein LigD
MLARAPAGIVFYEHADEDGAVVFRHACKLGLEGKVSKRLTPRGTGSRSRTRTARRCGGRGRGCGELRMNINTGK